MIIAYRLESHGTESSSESNQSNENYDPNKVEFIVDVSSLRELFTPELNRASLKLISH